MEADLQLLDLSLSQADRERISMQRPFAEAKVNRYETENAWVIEDGAA